MIKINKCLFCNSEYEYNEDSRWIDVSLPGRKRHRWLDTSKYCSAECMRKATQKKIEDSMESRYGVRNPYALESVKEKLKSISLAKYGVDNPSKSEEVKAKIKLVNLERYGAESTVSAGTSIRAKIEATNLDRYGSRSSLGCREVWEKTRANYDQEGANIHREATNLERYGVTNPFQSKEIQKKIRSTMISRYGVEYPGQSSELMKKSKSTRISRYGSYLSNKFKLAEYSREHLTNLDDWNPEYALNNLCNHDMKCIDINKVLSHFNCSYTYYCRYKSSLVPRGYERYRSQSQREVVDYIRSIYDGPIVCNDRSIISPYELDIVIPEFKVAFEYNGLFWHSDRYIDSEYHKMKTDLAESRGYHLYHIFDYEWYDKSAIWKSMISNSLRLSEKIYARKCILEEISSTDARDFCKRNHIQGYVESSIRYGLYYNGELVQVMTLGKPRYNKNYDLEIYRICSKLKTNVIGGVSRLLSQVVADYPGKSIISYGNRRWTSSFSNVYDRLGFNLIRVQGPSYWYIDSNCKRYSRVVCQKGKLARFLGDKYDPSKTEKENMIKAGYQIVTDSGQLVYVYDGGN